MDKKVIIYETRSGKKPFIEWHNKLDSVIQAIVFSRIDRVLAGNLGDCKIIKNGEGIWELRINYGPGYRIYFGKSGSVLVILLTAGNKGTQTRDIAKAKEYWLDFKEGN